MSTKQEHVLGATFNVWLLSFIFGIACEDATAVYWQILQQHASAFYWLQANQLKLF